MELLMVWWLDSDGRVKEHSPNSLTRCLYNHSESVEIERSYRSWCSRTGAAADLLPSDTGNTGAQPKGHSLHLHPRVQSENNFIINFINISVF